MQSWSSSLPLPLLLLKWNLRVILSPISWALHYSLGKVKVTCVDLFCSPPWHAELTHGNSCKVAISCNLLGRDMLLWGSVGKSKPSLVLLLLLLFLYLSLLFPSVAFSMTLAKCRIDNYHLKPGDMKTRNVPLCMILFSKWPWYCCDSLALSEVLHIYNALSSLNGRILLNSAWLLCCGLLLQIAVDCYGGAGPYRKHGENRVQRHVWAR